jgi:dihydropteroate synthase
MPARCSPTGADLVDVGGESTRPGAAPVGEAEEIDRVVPVIEALAGDGALVSVDTMKPAVMRAAIAAGASMVNDVRALREPARSRRSRKAAWPCA